MYTDLNIISLVTSTNIYRFFLIEKESLNEIILEQIFIFISTQYQSFGQLSPFKETSELLELSQNIDGDLWIISIFNKINFLDSRVIITNEEGAKFYFQH